MSVSNTKSRQTIDKFIATLQKSASSNEPDKGTSHPVGDVDDHTQPAAEGSRSAENAKDVKNDQGSPAVDNKEEVSATAGTTASDDHIQIGTKKAPTGEDPSTETSSVNSSLKDPGSSHPARVDNDALDGSKYASMSLEMLAKTASDTANEILASQELAQLMQQVAPAGQPAQKTASEVSEAGQVGWDLAGLVSGGLDKQALDGALQARMEDIIKVAAADADNVIEYLVSYQQQKQAMDAAVMGGMPPEAAMGGMPPEAAMGGMPPEAGAGGGGDELEQLMQLLEQLGITPEELMAAMAAEQGGGEGGGMAPGAGGPPEDAAAQDVPGLEVEASAKADKSSVTKEEDQMKQAAVAYLKEIVARNKK
jgi:hypothetical protein